MLHSKPEFSRISYTHFRATNPPLNLKIFDNLHTGIGIYGDKKQPVYYNKLFEHIFQVNQEIVNKILNLTVAATSKGIPISRLEATRTGIIAGSEHEVCLTSHGPYYKISITPLTDITERPYVQVEFKDITELKIMERKIQKAALENKAIHENLARILHDLKWPFTAVQSLAQIGLKLEVKKPVQHILADIDLSSKRALAKFVQEIDGVRFSQKMHKDIIKLSDVLEILRNEFFLHLIKHLRIKAKFSLPGKDFQLIGDLQTLRIALRNLLKNAIESMEDTKQKNLRVLAKIQDNKITIYITDTGKGIAEKLIDTLFQGFSSKRNTPNFGSGEGLPTALRIANAHGGSLKLVSSVTLEKSQANPALKPGTTFALTLPLLQTAY